MRYCQPLNSVTHVLDVLVTVGVVWTLGPLHWISLGYVFDALIFPGSYNAAMITSCVVGYAAVGGFTLMQNAAKRASLRYEHGQRFVGFSGFWISQESESTGGVTPKFWVGHVCGPRSAFYKRSITYLDWGQTEIRVRFNKEWETTLHICLLKKCYSR